MNWDEPGILSHKKPYFKIVGEGQPVNTVRSIQMFPDQPFVRFFSNVTNAGNSPYLINYGSVLAIEFPSPAATVPFTEIFHVNQWSYVEDEIHFEPKLTYLVPGRTTQEFQMGSVPSHNFQQTSCGWFAVMGSSNWGTKSDRQQSHHSTVIPGVVVGVEFDGKSTFHAYNSGLDDITHMWVDINTLNHSLAAGESFEVPGFFVSAFEGDWDDAAYATHQFAEQAIHVPLPDHNYPYVQYDSWTYGLDINEENQMAALKVAARIGVEVFVLDLGWATQIGEWVVDSSKFPNGLQPLVDFAHSNGMKFGLHVPIAQATMTSPIVQQNPDFVTLDGAYDYFGATALCLSHSPCGDAVINNVLTMIETYNIDYIVQDGEDMVKPCGKSSHSHNVGDSNYANSIQGIDRVWSAIKAMYPNLILEFCADGGTMLTYKMASIYTTAISVDDSDVYTTRQGIFGMSYPFSPRYSARYLQDDITNTYYFRSMMFGGPLILQLALGNYDANQTAIATENVATYKAYRQQIRSGKVIHLVPPSALSPDDGDSQNGIGWDAIQSVWEGGSVVLVFRASDLGNPNAFTIFPRGLDSTTSYLVDYHDAGIKWNMTGEQLATSGLNVTLPAYASEIIDIVEV